MAACLSVVARTYHHSNSSDNSTAAGNLKIEGSQDAEDSVSFAATGQKTFILGSSPGVVNVNIGALNSIVLTGFEFLLDPYDERHLHLCVAGVDLRPDADDNGSRP